MTFGLTLAITGSSLACCGETYVPLLRFVKNLAVSTFIASFFIFR
jgi:hypothetical protein